MVHRNQTDLFTSVSADYTPGAQAAARGMENRSRPKLGEAGELRGSAVPRQEEPRSMTAV